MATEEQFKSVEEMVEHLKKGGEVKSVNKVDKKKRKQHTDPTPKTDDVDIYRTTHFYVRKGDTWPRVLKDARGEIERCGPGTRVMAHDHKFNEPCIDLCRSVGE